MRRGGRLTMEVKICGLTRVEDAIAALEAEADMLGFNFYPRSQRYLKPARCARLRRALEGDLGDTLLVGVFVNSSVAEIEKVMAKCGLDLAQLHGDEPAGTLRALGGKSFKAIRPAAPADAKEAAQRFARLGPADGPALLIDSCRPGQYGGTGRLADWEVAKAVAVETPILLAGGLDPENVAAAVREVRPWGVDVASGVETSPGVKDEARMRAFVHAVRSGEREKVS